MFMYILQCNELGQALSRSILLSVPQVQCQYNTFLQLFTSSTEKNDATLDLSADPKALKVVLLAQRRKPHSPPVCVHMCVLGWGASVKNRGGHVNSHNILHKADSSTSVAYHHHSMLGFWTSLIRVDGELKTIEHMCCQLRMYLDILSRLWTIYYLFSILELHQ